MQYRKTGGKGGACQVVAGVVPDALTALPQWVVWIWTTRDDGKPTKVPLDPKSRGPAAVNDPETWGTFAEAVACHTRMGHGGGVGFVFTPSDPFFGLDIDHCRDKATGGVSEEARALLARFPTYAEVSPSGTGIKAIGIGVVPEGRKRTRNVEMYDRGRFFTVTGDVVADQPIDVTDCQDTLAIVHAELFPPGTQNQAAPAVPKNVPVGDDELIQRILKSKQAGKFSKLWSGDAGDYRKADGSPNHSAADLALCNILAFWCGGDEARIDCLFRQSGLCREKWEKRADYRKLTIDAALANRTNYYSPWDTDRGEPEAEPEYPRPEPECNVTDVATLLDLKEAGAKLEFLWTGWIQKAVVNLLAAEGGTGKTRFACDLVRRIRHGLPWPDGQVMTLPPDIRTLWVLSDNHHAEMVDVGEAFGIMDAVWVNAFKSEPYGGVMLDTEEDIKALKGRVKAIRPHLVIVDTVGGATSLNMSKQEDAKAFYGPLQILAREFNLAVLCLTHLSASGGVLGRRAVERVRSVIKMDKPDPDDDRRRVWVSKSNKKKPPPLGITMHDGGSDYDHEPPLPPEDADVGYDDPTKTGEQKPGQRRGKGRPKAAAATAQGWLEKILGDGPKPISVILPSAEHAGIKKATLYRASEALGVKTVEIGGVDHWEMGSVQK
jgi:putative DNA primase/helicase